MTAAGRFIVVWVFLALAGGAIHLRPDRPVPSAVPLAEFPASHNGWRAVGEQRFDERTLAVLKPTDYLMREYVTEGAGKVTLYIGYHGGGEGSGEIHSPRHCLPGSGWHLISSLRTSCKTPECDVNVVRSMYRKGENAELFVYWFQSGGKTISDDYALKLSILWNSLVRSRRDAAFVRLSINADSGEGEATLLGERFIRDFFPIISRHLPS